MLKQCFISLLCMLICSVNAVSLKIMQHNSNQSPRLLCLSGRIVEGEINDDGSDNVKVTLKLSLDIKNVGSKVALILRREPVVVERTIMATSSDRDDKYLYWLQTLPSIESSSKELQKRIDRSAPSPDVIRELAPGETWTLEIAEWFYISKRANIDPHSKSWGEIRQASPVWLQLTIEMWSGDIERFVDRGKLKFSKMLQHRWRRVGELQLENLTSDPMRLDFSSFTVKSTRQ